MNRLVHPQNALLDLVQPVRFQRTGQPFFGKDMTGKPGIGILVLIFFFQQPDDFRKYLQVPGGVGLGLDVEGIVDLGTRQQGTEAHPQGLAGADFRHHCGLGGQSMLMGQL